MCYTCIAQTYNKLVQNKKQAMDILGKNLRQVTPSDLKAFGIKIYSERGIAQEIIEMLWFTEQAYIDRLTPFIDFLVYTEDACHIHLMKDVKQDDQRLDAMEDVILCTLSKCFWRGKLMSDEEEPPEIKQPNKKPHLYIVKNTDIPPWL